MFWGKGVKLRHRYWDVYVVGYFLETRIK